MPGLMPRRSTLSENAAAAQRARPPLVTASCRRPRDHSRGHEDLRWIYSASTHQIKQKRHNRLNHIIVYGTDTGERWIKKIGVLVIAHAYHPDIIGHTTSGLF